MAAAAVVAVVLGEAEDVAVAEVVVSQVRTLAHLVAVAGDSTPPFDFEFNYEIPHRLYWHIWASAR